LNSEKFTGGLVAQHLALLGEKGAHFTLETHFRQTLIRIQEIG